MRSPDGFRTRLGESEVQHLSFSDQILYRRSDLFDQHLGIDPVLVKEINAVGSKTLQRRLRHLLDMLWAAIETTAGAFQVKTKLRSDPHLVANRRERFSDQFFIGIGAVNFCG